MKVFYTTKVSASDLDLGPDGEIILSLVTISNKFFLTQNGNTGELRLKQNLDYDKGDKNFNLSVTAAGTVLSKTFFFFIYFILYFLTLYFIVYMVSLHFILFNVNYLLN